MSLLATLDWGIVAVYFVLVFGVAIWVLIEAGRRLTGDVEVESGWMLAVAFAGLLANLVAFWLLRPGASESVNVEGAYLEVLGDLLATDVGRRENRVEPHPHESHRLFAPRAHSHLALPFGVR